VHGRSSGAGRGRRMSARGHVVRRVAPGERTRRRDPRVRFDAAPFVRRVHDRPPRGLRPSARPAREVGDGEDGRTGRAFLPVTTLPGMNEAPHEFPDTSVRVCIALVPAQFRQKSRGGGTPSSSKHVSRAREILIPGSAR